MYVHRSALFLTPLIILTANHLRLTMSSAMSETLPATIQLFPLPSGTYYTKHPITTPFHGPFLLHC